MAKRTKFEWTLSDVTYTSLREFGLFDQSTATDATVTSGAYTILTDDFNDGNLTGWTGSTAYFDVTTSGVFEGTYTLIGVNTTATEKNINISFTTVTGNATLSAYVKRANVADGYANIYLMNGAAVLGGINLQGGAIRAYAQGSIPVAYATPAVDTWYWVRYVHKSGDQADLFAYDTAGVLLGSTHNFTPLAATTTYTGLRVLLSANATTNYFDYIGVATTSVDPGQPGINVVADYGNMYYRHVLTDATTFSIADQYRVHMWFDFDDDSVGEAIVVNDGLNEIRDWISSISASAPSNTEWSDGTTAPVAATTSLDGTNKYRTTFERQTRKSGTRVEFETILPTSALKGTTSLGTTVYLVGQLNATTSGDLFGANKIPPFEHKNLYDVFQIDQYNFVE